MVSNDAARARAGSNPLSRFDPPHEGRAAGSDRRALRPLSSVVVVAAMSLLSALSAVAGSGPVGADPGDGLEELPAPIVIDVADESVDLSDETLVAEIEALHAETAREADSPSTALAPGLAHASGSGFFVDYSTTFPPPASARAVIDAAVSQWSSALASSTSGPVVIAVSWKNFGHPSILGSAGPNGLYGGPSLPTASLYPAALANTLLDRDVNGSSSPEIVVSLNSEMAWYINATVPPSGGQLDLYSVVLHEVGHGLGFIGSGSTSNGSGGGPGLNNPTYVYDRHVTVDGGALVERGDANNLLTSNNLFVNVSDVFDRKVYAPSSWEGGSSFSHFDESAVPEGSPGALMSPVLDTGESERDLDGAVLGVMSRIGWPMAVGPSGPNVTVAKNGGHVSVNLSVDLNKPGPAPDTMKVDLLHHGVVQGTQTVPATHTLVGFGGLAANEDYEVRAVGIASGLAGPATVTSTAASVPGAPSAISVSGFGLTQNVSWIDNQNSVTVDYSVERSSDGMTWYAVGSTTARSLTATVPSPGIYQFRVSASNYHGSGAAIASIPTGVGAGLARPVELDGQVVRAFRAAFVRDPDEAGFRYWREQIAGGANAAAVADVFVSGSEFVATYGQLSDADFIHRIYQNVLGRAPDAAGLAHWSSVLAQGKPRGVVVGGIAESAEFINRTGTVAPQGIAEAEVYRLYVAFFRRFPDYGGYSYWVGERKGGASLEAIASEFARSNEFITSYGSLDNAAFIALAYGNVLGRVPDADGASFWEARLAAGLDRGDAMVGFSESTEFIIKTGTLT